MSQTISIQGVKGAFHDEAAAILVPEAESVECVTFNEVFENVQQDKTDFGVVAIENSLHGPINPVYRLLENKELWIAGETTLAIEQYLIGCQDIEVEALNTPRAEVRTMFPAFAQCELYLQKTLPQIKHVERFDTAVAVKEVMEEKNPHVVAIAGKRAAKVYGATILTPPINDHFHNHTRFILVTKNKINVPEDANRTMIILTTDHQEGALYKTLGVFAQEKINLSKLASHPIPADTRHYAFYIDLEIGLNEKSCQESLKTLKDQGCQVKVLGSYRA